jgi:hypothetical protein
VLDLAAAESLAGHEVHERERAWLLVLDGEVAVTTAGGDSVGGPSRWALCRVAPCIELSPG